MCHCFLPFLSNYSIGRILSHFRCQTSFLRGHSIEIMVTPDGLFFKMARKFWMLFWRFQKKITIQMYFQMCVSKSFFILVEGARFQDFFKIYFFQIKQFGDLTFSKSYYMLGPTTVKTNTNTIQTLKHYTNYCNKH